MCSHMFPEEQHLRSLKIDCLRLERLKNQYLILSLTLVFFSAKYCLGKELTAYHSQMNWLGHTYDIIKCSTLYRVLYLFYMVSWKVPLPDIIKLIVKKSENLFLKQSTWLYPFQHFHRRV